MKKKLEEAVKSDFLTNLQQAVNSGDASQGAESINKINEIHKLASSMDGDMAKAKFEKRVEESDDAESIEEEEAKVLNLEAKKKMLEMKQEDEKMKIIANIENAETELKELNKEFKEVSKQYLEMIEKQEIHIEDIKNKFKEKYTENGERETEKEE